MTTPLLDDYAVFAEAAQWQSFSRAARQLQRSPKQVSKQVARLEAALGVRLFVRNTRHVRLTLEGETVLAHAREALATLDAMRESLQGDALAGMIRLTAPAPFGRKYVAPAIAEFHRLYPGIGFDLRLSDEVADLHGGQLDLAIRIGALPDSQLIARKISQSPRILVASPAYLRAHGSPETPAALHAHQCLLFAYPGHRCDVWDLQHGDGRRECIAIDSRFLSDSGEVLHRWCLEGLGISLRESWDVHEHLAQGTLVRVLPGWQAPVADISLVYAARKLLPRRLVLFMDFLHTRWQSAPFGRDADSAALPVRARRMRP